MHVTRPGSVSIWEPGELTDLLVVEHVFEVSKPLLVQRSSSLMPLVFCSLGPKRPMTQPHCSVSAPTLALKSPIVMTLSFFGALETVA